MQVWQYEAGMASFGCLPFPPYTQTQNYAERDNGEIVWPEKLCSRLNENDTTSSASSCKHPIPEKEAIRKMLPHV